MDEMGHQDWADRQDKLCFVPVAHQGDVVYVAVPRTGKRITIVTGIAADGSYVKPLVVIPRKTVDDDLPTTGLTPRKIAVMHQPKGFIDQDIFLFWARNHLVPDFQRRREELQYDGPAVLILDGCTAHAGAEFEQLCTDNKIICVFLPPHSSNQLQPLDLSLFGVTKKRLVQVNGLESHKVQTRHIHKVVNCFMEAATPSNIVGTFRRAGIAVVYENEQLLCRVSPELASAVMESMEYEWEEEGEPEEDDEDIELDEYRAQTQGTWLDLEESA
jgi:hypothetical protein